MYAFEGKKRFFLYPVTNAFRQFAYTGSIYTIVGLTLERYLTYCRPDKAKSFCTPRKARILIAVISIFSLIYTIPVFCEFKWTSFEGEIKVTKTDIRKKGTETSDTYYLIYRTWMNFLFRNIIPTLCLVISNILIIKKVKWNKYLGI